MMDENTEPNTANFIYSLSARIRNLFRMGFEKICYKLSEREGNAQKMHHLQILSLK
jgi:hypothetical protein